VERRITGFVSSIKRRPNVKPPSFYDRFRRLKRLIVGMLRPGRQKLPPEVRRVFRNVIRHTLRTAPYMTGHVVGMLMYYVGETLVHSHHCGLIQEQIDDVVANGMRPDKDPTAGTVPPIFRKKVREVLPTVYDRLTAGIEYRPAVSEAMIAVIKDFIIRWAENFQGFEPHHLVYLNELCDRYIERANANYAHVERNGGRSETGLAREQVTLPQFIQALMVSVEQELRAGVKQVALTGTGT
jgi:hypothetical protein